MGEEGDERGCNDGRCRNDDCWRCKDEGGRSGERSDYVIFEIRVGIVGFRKKKSIYMSFFKK